MIPPLELIVDGDTADTLYGWPLIPREGEFLWARTGKFRVDAVIHAPHSNEIALKVTEVDPETHEPI